MYQARDRNSMWNVARSYKKGGRARIEAEACSRRRSASRAAQPVRSKLGKTATRMKLHVCSEGGTPVAARCEKSKKENRHDYVEEMSASARPRPGRHRAGIAQLRAGTRDQ